MNLLSTIIERLNQRVEAGNIFDQIYGLCELSADGNDKAWIHYIGNGQAIPVTNFDAKQGTIFWAKRGKISVSKNESLKLAGCKALYETKFTLSAYAVVRKDHLPCDSADAQDWIASRVLRLVSGSDPQFKTAIGVVAYEVVPNGYVNEIKSLTANYEWACVSIDVDVNVLTSSEDGCYDTCATGDIPLPDFLPCNPCLTEVAVDGITIIGNGTVGDPLIAIGGGGGGALIALPFTTDHLAATGNAYAVGNIVWYLGNVYRCIAANDSILPTNTTYWVNLGAGFPTVQQPSDWNSTSGNNQILNKPTIPAAQVNSDWNASSGVAEILNKPTIPAAQSLQEVTDVGNTTDNDIQFDTGVGILLDNTSRLREGTIDAGLGGTKGIAQICAVGYELKWEAGRLYVMDGNGILIRWSLYNFNVTPTVNDDSTKGYTVGSLWGLDDNTLYLCSDATLGAAVWTLQSGSVSNLQDVTDVGNTTTNDLIVQGANDYVGQVSSQVLTVYNTVSNAYAEMFVGTSGQLTLSDGTSAGILSVNNIVSANVQLEFPNKPTGNYTIATTADLPAAQIQSDWNQANNAALDFIKNKPTITSGTVTSVNSGINISVDNTNPAAPIINSLSDRYKTTSTTSNSVSNGSKSFTVDLNLSYIPLQEILVVHNPANHMHGEVTSYNSATGALVVDIKTHTGSGTYTAWTLNLDGTPVDALTGSGTPNEIAYFTAARVLASLPVATYPSLTELSYVKGVTSAIQTQINGKFTTPSGTTSQYVRGDGSLATFPSLPLLYKDLNNQAAVTGNTNNNKVVSVLIPANTITVGSIVDIKARVGKTGGAGITTLRVYANTADSIVTPAPTLIITSATASIGQVYNGMDRSAIVKSATVTQTAQANASIQTDASVGNATLTNSNIDWTAAQYLIFAIQNGANGDSTVLSYYEITIK
jgi:hypothetical protein